jgi:hypothetical protein
VGRAVVAGVLAGALVLAGCGSSGGMQTRAVVTVPAYGVFPATTVAAGTAGSAKACRRDAEAFADGARMFLAHSGPRAAYPADLYYVILREAVADFRAHGCAPALLGDALVRTLGAQQRRALVAGLPASIAATVNESLAARR